MATMTRELTGTVEIVPGVVGPAEVFDDRGVITSPAGRVTTEVRIRFDSELRRYICREFTARSRVGQPLTADALRYARIADQINMALLTTTNFDEPEQPIKVLDNPDGREPWGLTPPGDIADRHGPTDRALKWTAHIYKYGYAVSYNPTLAVMELLKLPRSTAGRWIAAARKAGYLGPSEGTGKAGG
jgi:hypothetical protein